MYITHKDTGVTEALSPSSAYLSSDFKCIITASGFFFKITNFGSGTELWHSDGTAVGTRSIKNINQGGSSFNPGESIAIDNVVYFIASTSSGQSVWRTDGTDEGTVAIPLSSPSTPSIAYIKDLKSFNGRLLFTVKPNSNKAILYSADPQTGTAAGIAYIDPVTVTGIADTQIYPCSEFNGEIYFSSSDRLLASNGTPASGRQVISAPSPPFYAPYMLGVAGGKLYFSVNQGEALWCTDGTEAGSHWVSENVPDIGNLGDWKVLPAPQQLLFKKTTPENGAELWATMAPQEGTRLLKDISTGTTDALWQENFVPNQLFALDETIYFTADDGEHGFGLWKTDGTEEGTVLVKDAVAGDLESSPRLLTRLGDHLYFGTNAGVWRTDGTAEGTLLISPKRPIKITSTSNRLFFLSDFSSSTFGSELWCSDGTEEGTTLLLNGTMSEMVTLGEELLFTNLENRTDAVLWKSNGTPQGTIAIKTLVSGNIGSVDLFSAAYLTKVGNQVHFLTHVYGAGTFWWQSDGTSEGTISLKKVTSKKAGVTPGSFGSTSKEVSFQRIGEKVSLVLFFNSNPFNLWITDGTPETTVEVNTRQVVNSETVTSFNNALYWIDDYRRKVYRSEGSDETTGALFNLTPPNANNSNSPSSILNLDRQFLFFGTTNGSHHLWASDGTAAGTYITSTLPGNGLGISPFVMAATSTHLFYAQSSPGVGHELHAIAFAPELAVMDESDARLSVENSVDSGSYSIGTLAPIRGVTLRNVGLRPLSLQSVSVLGQHQNDFTLVNAALPPQLEPGQKVTLEIRFSPLSRGDRHAVLQILSNDAEQATFELDLTGQGLYQAPEITTHPESSLWIAGQSAALHVTAEGEALLYQWRKSTEDLPGENAQTDTLSIANVNASNVGLYEVHVENDGGEEISKTALVGVISAALPSTHLIAGEILSLECHVVTPPDTIVAYHWQFNGLDLTGSEHGVSGYLESTLQISEIEANQAGIYTCRVTMSLPEGESLAQNIRTGTEVQVISQPPEIAGPLPDVYLGQTVALPIEASGFPTLFSAKGLPPGVTLDSLTGILSGKPMVAKTYQLTITATNHFGSTTSRISWIVQKLPEVIIGTYEVSIPRHEDNRNLGGWMRFTLTNKGSLTGSAFIAGLKHAFKGLVSTTSEDGHSGQFELEIKRGKLPALPLALTIADSTGPMLVSGTLNGVPLEGWICPYGANRQPPQFGALNTALLYTGESDTGTGSSERPRGDSYAIAKISSKGIVNWKGFLADGTSFTASHLLGASDGTEDDTPTLIHAPLYKAAGSLHGRFQLSPGAEAHLNGAADWFKIQQPEKAKTRSYKQGFGPLELSLLGEFYTKPNSGNLVLGLPSETNNVQLIMDEGGLSEMVTQNFTLGSKGVKVEPGTDNPLKFTLKVTPSTGLISGTFTLQDPNPQEGKKPTMLLRKTKISGLIVTHPEVQSGIGFFNLAKLPDTAGEKITLTPLQSGRVNFGTVEE